MYKSKFGQRYLTAWRRMFSQLFGWTNERTDRWALIRYEEFIMDHRLSPCRNESDYYMAADQLVPTSIRGNLNAYDLKTVEIDLDLAIFQTINDHYKTQRVKTFSSDFGSEAFWQDVVKAIDRILRLHGSSFDELLKEKQHN